MEKLIATLLYNSNIYTIDENDFNLQLLSHSEYPSLKAITDTLDYFGVENIAANVPKDALDQLPEYFLAIIERKNHPELTMVKKKRERLILKRQNGKTEKRTIEEFKSEWNGTIIAIEKEIEKEKPLRKRINLKSITVLFLITLGLAVYINSESSLTMITHGILSIVGLIVSYFIVKEDLGLKDEVTAKVCGAISKKHDGCGAVIQSDRGKLPFGIKLGDASMIFFFGMFILTFSKGFHVSTLYTISLLSLPVVLFSFYAQAFKLKQWCLLCLGIAAVLLSQFAVLQLTFADWDFSFSYTLSALSIYVFSAVGWKLLKDIWRDSIQLQKTKQSFLKFKRHTEFFMAALKNKEPIPSPDLEEISKVTFGKPSAEIEITTISNPLCGYCTDAFEAYNQLLKNHPDDIKLSFVFSVPDDVGNKANQITTRVLEFYENDPLKAFESLQTWFKSRNIEKWQDTYGLPQSMSLFSEKILEAHKNWCAENELYYTPATFLKGLEFPRRKYDLEDLRFFIQDLKGFYTKEDQTINI